MEKMNEFQETIGRQAREQADSFFEFLQQDVQAFLARRKQA